MARVLSAVAALALALIAAAGAARAEVVDTIAGGTIDWSRGVVTATGIGLADRHAPSPAVARAASRRRADDDATAHLAAALAVVPWAEDGKPADLATRDGWIASHAVVIDATLNPDGSWKVTLGLPIEAIRLGLAGARVLGKDGDHDDARTVVIDARKLAGVKPIGAVAIKGGAAGPTLWVDRDPPAALAGAKPVRLTATALAGGVITVGGHVPDLAGALIVVVVPKP